ncbi:hypothetical protein OIU85_022147 [Salix viminalis]|uniref:Uncharacterized protein n=1 Tax=Salix viminalis TaxID=40686 RepID=A0A9Q0U660_SALVM|nr:hypothetical protein OIU85_022147 [Salix viminalis]
MKKRNGKEANRLSSRKRREAEVEERAGSTYRERRKESEAIYIYIQCLQSYTRLSYYNYGIALTMVSVCSKGWQQIPENNHNYKWWC